MKYLVSFICFLCLFSESAFSQINLDSLRKTNYNRDSLSIIYQQKLDSLERVVTNILGNNTQTAAESYYKSYNNARIAIDLINTLYTTVNVINSDKDKHEADNLFNQINNPTNGNMGFKFSDKIIDYAKGVIQSSNIPSQHQTNLISSITNIAKGLENSFPPLNIVTSVISSIASFNIPFINKLSNRLKTGDSIPINNNTPVTVDMLAKFSNEIKPYVDFYQDLNNNSIQFSNELKLHETKYYSYFPSILSLKTKYQSALNIDITNTTTNPEDTLDKIFDRSREIPNANFYNGILIKDQIKTINSLTIQSIELAKDFKPFYDDYYSILLKNSNNNIQSLNSAMNLPSADSTKINQLINQYNDLRKGTDVNNPGFEGEFKQNLEKILSNISRIIY